MLTGLKCSTEELGLDAILPQLLQSEQRQGMAQDSVTSTRDISVPESATAKENLGISKQAARFARRRKDKEDDCFFSDMCLLC